MSEFLFGSGFAIAGGDLWRVRRKAVGPALHRAYLQTMVDRVFGPSAEQLCAKLEVRRRNLKCMQNVGTCLTALALSVNAFSPLIALMSIAELG